MNTVKTCSVSYFYPLFPTCQLDFPTEKQYLMVAEFPDFESTLLELKACFSIFQSCDYEQVLYSSVPSSVYIYIYNVLNGVSEIIQ